MYTKITFKIKPLLVLMFMFTMTQQLTKAQCNYTQMSIGINGESDLDRLSTSVAISSDGLTVALGATLNSGGGVNRGHVRVFKYLGGIWVQQGADINGEGDGDFSGNSVSLSADGLTVAVGAADNDGEGYNRGHVRVYKYISGNWTQHGADINGEADSDHSGVSVSLSDDGLTLAIGAFYNNGGVYGKGQVRVYKSISGTWTQQGADIDGEADGDRSGESVSLSADGLIVAIGAYKNNGGGTSRGHVRVYKSISGTWTQQGADIDGEADNDRSGWSVSLSADGLTVAIGAPQNAGGGIYYRGQVRVYKNIGGIWTRQGGDIDGEADNDRLGWSVSLSADGLTLAIAVLSNVSGTFRGHVQVYKNISGIWTQQGDKIEGKEDSDAANISVSLSSDGITAVIGSPLNDGGGAERGQARVYKCIPTTGVSHFKKERLGLVYPNPFNEILNLGLNLQEKDRVNVTILDAMGKVVFSSLIDESKTTLDLKALSSGFYILHIFSIDHKESFKILKQ